MDGSGLTNGPLISVIRLFAVIDSVERPNVDSEGWEYAVNWHGILGQEEWTASKHESNQESTGTGPSPCSFVRRRKWKRRRRLMDPSQAEVSPMGTIRKSKRESLTKEFDEVLKEGYLGIPLESLHIHRN